MKKLIYILLLLPIWANAQVNGTIQKTPATGTVRGAFGSSGIDTIPNGFVQVWRKSTGKISTFIPTAITDAARGVALQNAVLSLGIGDALTIGSGSYLVTTKLEISKDDVSVVNKGRIYHTNNAIDIFQIDSAKNVSISGGILEGAGYAIGSMSAESGVQISGTSRNVSISNMLIRKVRGSGVYMNNLSDTPLADSLRFRNGLIHNVNVDQSYIGYGFNAQYWKVDGGNVSNGYYGQYVNSTNSITTGINNSNNQIGAFVDASGDHGLIANSNFNHNFLGAFYFRNLTIGFDLTGNHIFPRNPTGGDSTIVIDGSKGINFNGGTWGQGSTPFEVHLLGTFTGYNSFRNIGFIGQSPLITGTTPQESHQIWEGNYVIDSLTSGLNRAVLPIDGGTGVKQPGTITVSGNTSIGSSTHTVTLNTTGNTSVTLPTSGTLSTTTGTITALTGDVSASGTGSVTATLSTVNSNVGSFGSSTSIPSFTVNAKGLITAASGNAVVAPAGTLTGTTLASNVVTSSLTSLAGFVASGSSGVTQTSTGVYPTLGTWNGGFGVSNSTANFGLDIGVSNAAGDVWLQAHRRDGVATAYNIVLNPSGGYAIATTPSPNDNSTKVATTAYVDAQAGTSGTYTPTLTNVANITSSSLVSASYIRVGNQVMVEIVLNATPTTAAGTTTTFDVSLPISSNFSTSTNLRGGATGTALSSSFVAIAIGSADSTNDRGTFSFPANFSGSSATFSVHFQYTVL